MRAEVRERLQATEIALRDTRLENVTLRERDTKNLLRITHLENTAQRQQPTDSPQFMLRIQELDSENKDLRKELAAQVTESGKHLSEQIRQKDQEANKLQKQLSQSQASLGEARGQAADAERAKTELEQQAVIIREQVRTESSKTLEAQLSKLKLEHQTAILQIVAQVKQGYSDDLNSQLKTTRENYEKATTQLNTLQAEKDKLQKQAVGYEASLVEAHTSRVAAV